MESEILSTSGTSSSQGENRCSAVRKKTKFAPRRIRRIQRRQTLGSSSALISSSDDSSDDDFQQVSEEISKFFENPFRKWGKQRRKVTKKTKFKSKKSQRGQSTTTKRKPQYSIPMEERSRRLRDRGIQFPFTPLKYLPFKLHFSYEQFVLGGFLNHIKNLKHEQSLKKSLKDMKMDEDLENENFQMRGYPYLDEDGPLSPISEPGEDLNEDEAEEEEVKVVENSTFILGCQVPSKNDWQIKKKGKKRLSANNET